MPIDQASYYRDGIHLWRTVIFRAQLEADGKYRPTTEERETQQELVDAAQEWLVSNSQDFRIVCHLAALDATELLPVMRRKYGRGSSTDSNAGLD